MRITQSLWAQHIYQMFKKHWKVQGVRIPKDTGALQACDETGIQYEDILEVAKWKRPIQMKYVFFVVIFLNQLVTLGQFFLLYFLIRVVDPLMEPQIHELWNSRPCHIHEDSNVLVNGLDQAQILTKTLMFGELPKKLQDIFDSIEISPESDKCFKNATLAAHLFDAEQVVLPKRKDPLRPAWNFPRDYGISDQRKW